MGRIPIVFVCIITYLGHCIFSRKMYCILQEHSFVKRGYSGKKKKNNVFLSKPEKRTTVFCRKLLLRNYFPFDFWVNEKVGRSLSFRTFCTYFLFSYKRWSPLKKGGENWVGDYAKYTVWKFKDFTVTQILREINIGESRSSKTEVFAILGAWILLILSISAF